MKPNTWDGCATPEMVRAARRFRHYIRTEANLRGRIVRLPCVFCGSEDSEAHHPDYERWWLVSWLCFRHHRQVDHGSLRLHQKHLFDYSSLLANVMKRGLQRTDPVRVRPRLAEGEVPF